MVHPFILRIVTTWAYSIDNVVAVESIRVLSTSTISDIKVLLFNTIIDRVAPYRQTIYHNRMELCSSKTMAEYGIRRGHVLLVRMARDEKYGQ